MYSFKFAHKTIPYFNGNYDYLFLLSLIVEKEGEKKVLDMQQEELPPTPGTISYPASVFFI